MDLSEILNDVFKNLAADKGLSAVDFTLDGSGFTGLVRKLAIESDEAIDGTIIEKLSVLLSNENLELIPEQEVNFNDNMYNVLDVDNKNHFIKFTLIRYRT